jgi:mono/diheme cytochrome c family protein
MMKWLAFTGAVFTCFAWAAEEPVPSVFTAAQAEAGRAAAMKTCAQCHTPSLQGRVGNPGENPPLGSLSGEFQDFVSNSRRGQNVGKVPPLLGPVFMSHWEAKTTKDLAASITGTAKAFFPGTDDQTALAITAYILQLNGAKSGSQELSASTAVEIRSLSSH